MGDECKTQRWLPIESNPEVMNKFLHNCGLPEDKWAISDVYGLDEALLAMLPQPVLSLMLLFPINEKYEEYCGKQEETLKNTPQVNSKRVTTLKRLWTPPQNNSDVTHSYVSLK